MTEILTESFCERCGTRYTFEPVQSKRRGLGKIGTLGRGFRHFVSDPGSSLDEAFAVARSEQEQRSTTHALEAFHRTFNFCLNCRQYTCGDCWNAVEGRCLSCAPTGESLEPPPTRMDTAVVLPPLDAPPARVPLELEEDADLRNAGPWIGGTPAEQAAASEQDAPVLDEAPVDQVAFEPLPDLELPTNVQAEPTPEIASAEAIDARLAVPPTDDAITGILDEPAAAATDVLADLESVAAAPTDEPVEAVAEPIEAEEIAALTVVPDAPPVVDAVAGRESAVEAVPPAEAIAEAAPPAEAEPEPVAAEAAEAAAADAGLVFAPGLNLDEQIAAYERRMAAEHAEPEPEAVEQVAPSVEEPAPAVAEAPALAASEPVVAQPEPEPVAAEAAPEPEPVAAEPVAAQPEPGPVAAQPEPVVAEPEPGPVAAEPEPVAAEARPEPEPVAAQPEPVPAQPEPEPVAAEAEPEPVAAEAQPEPVAAEAEPAPAAPTVPEPSQQLPVAASKPAPPSRIEPIPTAIGTPLPASVVDGPLAWPDSDIAAAAFEQQWPDIPVPRRPAPETPPAAPQPIPPQVVQQAPAATPSAPIRRTGANLPSVSAPPPVLTARACPSCGLSLSASARFCRRCGTPQQADAAR